MTLPIVRMETNSYPNSTLTFATGDAITVTNGRANVPWRSVGEAIAKNFIVSDPAVKYPPRKGDMCPPTPLTPVVYAAPALTNVLASTPLPAAAGGINFPWLVGGNPGATPIPTGRNPGDPGYAAPFNATADVLSGRNWVPPSDTTPFAQLTLPDSTVLQVPYPGSNVITIPDKHIAYYKGQGWTLLSEWM